MERADLLGEEINLELMMMKMMGHRRISGENQWSFRDSHIIT